MTIQTYKEGNREGESASTPPPQKKERKREGEKLHIGYPLKKISF